MQNKKIRASVLCSRLTALWRFINFVLLKTKSNPNDTKFDFGWHSARDPARGDYGAPQTS